jgi:hypothetical protein
MADKVLSTLQIGYGDDSDAEVLNRPISASVDADQNGNQTRFFVSSNGVSDRVIITVTSAASISRTRTTYGNLSRSGSIVRDITEFITFVETNEGTLSNIPKSASFFFKFVGQTFNPARVIVDGKTIKILNSGDRVFTGMIEATYRADADLYRLSGGKDPTLCVFTNVDGNSASVVINFLPEECDIPVNDVVIITKDNQTGAPIGRAEVRINGVARGRTGNDGKLSIGRLTRGEVNTIDVIVNGYQRPGEDCLDNSEFTL